MKFRLRLALVALPVLFAFPHPAAAQTDARPAQAASPPAHLITINKARFKLSLWRHVNYDSGRGYKLQRRWKVAVGMPGHATPAGVYRITTKALNPSWTAPNSSWVPVNQRGQYFQGGSKGNPIAAAFLSISAREGLGIHGTTNVPSLGTRASHGCIRMSIKSVLSLAKLAEVGTPVVIR